MCLWGMINTTLLLFFFPFLFFGGCLSHRKSLFLLSEKFELTVFKQCNYMFQPGASLIPKSWMIAWWIFLYVCVIFREHNESKEMWLWMQQGQGDGKDGLIINKRHLTTSSETQQLFGRNNGTFVSAVTNSSDDWTSAVRSVVVF